MPVNFDVTAFDPHVGQLNLSGDGVVIGVNIAVFVGQFIKRRRVVIILFVAIVVGQRGFRSQPARQLNFPVGDVQIIIGGAALYQTVQIDITAAQEMLLPATSDERLSSMSALDEAVAEPSVRWPLSLPEAIASQAASGLPPI